MILHLFKLQYNKIDSNDAWTAYLLATDREDAEGILKKRIKFPFSITYAEHLGRVDAISEKALNKILFDNKISQEISQETSQETEKQTKKTKKKI